MGRLDLSKKISLFVVATVVASNIAFADVSKNCISDVKLNSDGNNVKVNIYTTKPYTDSVVVSKKEGNKYVILVPETTSSLKSAPKVTGSSNVSVSMQTISAGKGYTKIIVTSDKAINVQPKTITASAPVKTVTPTTNVVAQTKTTSNTVSQQKTTTKPVVSKPVQAQPKPTQTTSKTTKTTTATKPIVKPTQQVKVVESKPVTPKVVETKPVQVANKTPDVSRNKPFEILEEEVKTDKISDIKEQKSDALLEKTIKDNDEIIKKRKALKRKNKKKRVPIVDPKMSAKECIKLVLDEMRTLDLWKLLLLAGAISFPIIVIMIILGMDKRINKKINSMRKEDDVVVAERELTNDIQAVIAQKNEQPIIDEQDFLPEPVINQEVPEFEQTFDSFDDMLDKVEDTSLVQENYSEFEVELPDENVEEQIQTVDEVEQTIIEPILEEPEMLDEGYDEPVSEPVLPDTVVDTSIQAPVQIVPYEPDGVLADFSNVTDKEFFDELVLQSFAEKDVNNLPENTSADVVFDVMTEDESGVMLSDFEVNSFDRDSENTVHTSDSSDDDVKMLKEVQIDDKTGLYLVDYDNYSSLVGHVADDYFVIKRFEGLVNSNIIVKEAEKMKDSTRYLVRVGRNKMIIEVNDSSMNRLIDL